MLLLEIERGGDRLVQGFVRVRWPAGGRIATGQVAGWVNLFVRSALLWNQVQPLSIAVRLTARPSEPLTSIHCLVTPKQQEARLRLVLAAFLRTNGMGNADSDTPQEMADLPGNFTHCDDARFIIAHERLQTPSGFGIHYNLRLADRLPRLMQTLVDLQAPVAYEAQITPWSPPRELLRPVLYDAARLEEVRSAPRELVLDQRALAERLTRAAQQRPAYHLEECLATSAELGDAVRETTTNLLSETVYGSFGATPQLVEPPPAQAEAFGYHVHSQLMNGSLDLASAEAVTSAATKGEVDRLLCCAALMPGDASSNAREPPGGALFLNLTGPPSPLGGGPSGGGNTPPASSGEQPYLFISYARDDGEVVYPLIDELGRRGVSLWIDRRIIGGEDWLAELEARLIQCVGVIALISPSFVKSKYCAREVHFADALNRPILPVALTPGIQLSRGLRFLLHNVQVINLFETGISAILDAVDRHAQTAVTAARLV